MRRLALLSLLAIACSSPEQPKRVGPGCTLVFRDIIDTLDVKLTLRVHYPVCPLIELDLAMKRVSVNPNAYGETAPEISVRLETDDGQPIVVPPIDAPALKSNYRRISAQIDEVSMRHEAAVQTAREECQTSVAEAHAAYKAAISTAESIRDGRIKESEAQHDSAVATLSARWALLDNDAFQLAEQLVERERAIEANHAAEQAAMNGEP